MAIITTKNFSNPPSVRGIDYAGQPIPENGYYNGRPEHQNPNRETRQDAPRNAVKPPPTRRKRQSAAWTPEKRKLFADRMRERMAKWRESRRSMDSQSVVPSPDLPSVTPSVDT